MSPRAVPSSTICSRAGSSVSRNRTARLPIHPAHSTTVAGLAQNAGGRQPVLQQSVRGNGQARQTGGGTGSQPAFQAGWGLWVYDQRPLPLQTAGNVYYLSAPAPMPGRKTRLTLPDHNPAIAAGLAGQTGRPPPRAGDSSEPRRRWRGDHRATGQSARSRANATKTRTARH